MTVSTLNLGGSLRIAACASLLLLQACGSASSPVERRAASASDDAPPIAAATLATGPLPLAAAALTVRSDVVGTTPEVLGYNIAHLMPDSNAMDWWRYSGIRAARVFLSPSDVEPVDDIAGAGDGVASQAAFEARRAALRANAADPTTALDPQYVNWTAFQSAYASVATGNNRFAVSTAFPMLRQQGVEILANITASPSRFPVAGDADYANLWELWQHYYAQAFLLARDHGVRRFSVFNEPNGWSPAITVEEWALRLRVCSDAIQSAIADVNARYGRALVAQVFAPNTANGATKYDDPSDYWGRQAVLQRQQGIWAAAPAGRVNFHVYNYQKYSMLTDSTSTASGYIDDYDTLRARIVGDVGEPGLPMALTEYNVRTGSSYDGMTQTADSPSDYVALAANSVALAARGATQLYLFKFGMTARASPTNYPVAKNGTHYVNNATSGVNNYGGAAATAEVYRLFARASGTARQRLGVDSTLGSDVWVQATRTPDGRTLHLFIANRGTTAAAIDVDLTALAPADGSLVTAEEVSERHRGGVAWTAAVSGGRIPTATLGAQSVWLLTVHDGASATPASIVAAAGDAALRDGSSGRTTTGGTTNPLVARADGTTAGRRVAVLRFPVPYDWSTTRRVLLALNVATTSGTSAVQAHVYGLDDDSWNESTVTFASLTTGLRQGVASGNVIANNVVASPGTRTHILGQLLASSTTPAVRYVDVTDFVTRQSDGFASFLVVQDHRWDVKLPEKTTGDTQPAGLAITSREGTAPPALRLHGGAVPGLPPSITTQPAPMTVVQGAAASFSVTAAGDPVLQYQWRRNGSAISGANAATFTINATTLADAGTYSVVVINPYGSVTSSDATLTVTGGGSGGTPVSAEFESLAVNSTSGDSIGIKSDRPASGGKSVLYRSNAVGDWITFALPVPTAGTYSVAITAKMQSDRGRFQMATAESPAGPWTNIDTPKDEYRATLTFGSVGSFTQRVTFGSPGTKYLRFTVSGRNPASSGYLLDFDRITLTP